MPTETESGGEEGRHERRVVGEEGQETTKVDAGKAQVNAATGGPKQQQQQRQHQQQERVALTTETTTATTKKSNNIHNTYDDGDDDLSHATELTALHEPSAEEAHEVGAKPDASQREPSPRHKFGLPLPPRPHIRQRIRQHVRARRQVHPASSPPDDDGSFAEQFSEAMAQRRQVMEDGAEDSSDQMIDGALSSDDMDAFDIIDRDEYPEDLSHLEHPPHATEQQHQKTTGWASAAKSRLRSRVQKVKEWRNNKRGKPEAHRARSATAADIEHLTRQHDVAMQANNARVAESEDSGDLEDEHRYGPLSPFIHRARRNLHAKGKFLQDIWAELWSPSPPPEPEPEVKGPSLNHKLLRANVSRFKDSSQPFIAIGKKMKAIQQWHDRQESFLVLSLYMFSCYFDILLLSFALVLLIFLAYQRKYPYKDVHIKSDRNLFEKAKLMKMVVTQVQNRLGATADVLERIINLVRWRSPSHTWKVVAVLVGAVIVLSLAPFWLVVRGLQILFGYRVLVLPGIKYHFPHVYRKHHGNNKTKSFFWSIPTNAEPINEVHESKVLFPAPPSSALLVQRPRQENHTRFHPENTTAAPLHPNSSTTDLTSMRAATTIQQQHQLAGPTTSTRLVDRSVARGMRERDHLTSGMTATAAAERLSAQAAQDQEGQQTPSSTATKSPNRKERIQAEIHRRKKQLSGMVGELSRRIRQHSGDDKLLASDENTDERVVATGTASKRPVMGDNDRGDQVHGMDQSQESADEQVGQAKSPEEQLSPHTHASSRAPITESSRLKKEHVNDDDKPGNMLLQELTGPPSREHTPLPPHKDSIGACHVDDATSTSPHTRSDPLPGFLSPPKVLLSLSPEPHDAHEATQTTLDHHHHQQQHPPQPSFSDVMVSSAANMSVPPLGAGRKEGDQLAALGVPAKDSVLFSETCVHFLHGSISKPRKGKLYVTREFIAFVGTGSTSNSGSNSGSSSSSSGESKEPSFCYHVSRYLNCKKNVVLGRVLRVDFKFKTNRSGATVDERSIGGLLHPAQVIDLAGQQRRLYHEQHHD